MSKVKILISSFCSLINLADTVNMGSFNINFVNIFPYLLFFLFFSNLFPDDDRKWRQHLGGAR